MAGSCCSVDAAALCLAAKSCGAMTDAGPSAAAPEPAQPTRLYDIDHKVRCATHCERLCPPARARMPDLAPQALLKALDVEEKALSTVHRILGKQLRQLEARGGLLCSAMLRTLAAWACIRACVWASVASKQRAAAALLAAD